MADMFETNSRSLVEDMQAEVERIDNLLKKGGLTSVLADALTKNKKNLQNSLNKFLTDKKVLTQGDYDQAYDILRTSKMTDLDDTFSKSAIKLGLLVAGAGLLYYLFNRKK